MKTNIRIFITTCTTFLVALFVTFFAKSSAPFFYGMPFSLAFDICCSLFLTIYYASETALALKAKK